MKKNQISGAAALWKSLMEEGVDTVFGYPGGQIMPVYDSLCDFEQDIRHILVRHEQGAVHAAQGYARIKGQPGVVIVTSGPGATNVVTGIVDALTDSTPLVVITGQVSSAALGTDAFQEADVTGLTGPISKWNYQIRRAEDVAWAVARAFYIARTGRPGPVVLDFTKDAQVGLTDFHYEKCDYIRSYIPEPKISDLCIRQAVDLLDRAERPLVVFGQGVILSGAEQALKDFLTKGDIPAGSTLLGLSSLSSDFPLYQGMIGMHGNVAPNIMTNQCDLLIAVGMRFDDRVTGTVNTYATQAHVIHIDIDPSEIGKIIPVTVGIKGDARKVLTLLTEKMQARKHPQWLEGFRRCREVEQEKVIRPELHPAKGDIHMGEVVDTVSRLSGEKAIVVTDVGQNQMIAARYSRFSQTRSFLSSGGLGTMGFGLPAAMGAKIAAPDRPVCLFVGDGGIQMRHHHAGKHRREDLPPQQQLAGQRAPVAGTLLRETVFPDPHAESGLPADRTGLRHPLHRGGPPRGMQESNVMPMIPPGKGINQIMLSENEWYE